MKQYDVAETFVSINGEGVRAGQLAVFIRFCGCNLRCSFCDTQWANGPQAPHRQMSAQEIVSYIRQTNVRNVTLTGGEPLLRDGMTELLARLAQEDGRYIEIETNGSVDLSPFVGISPSITFTMDYKLAGSGMERYMCTDNFSLLRADDTVKFVISDQADLERARAVIEQYALTERCHVYLSPVFGRIEPADIVAYMQMNTMNAVNMQLQMHKFIWDPDKRGV